MILPKGVLFLLGSFGFHDVFASNNNFSDKISVVNITTEILAEMTGQNKTAFILFYSDR